MDSVKKRFPRWVECIDDERAIGNGVIVTLIYGWSFSDVQHQGVMSFHSLSEAREAVRKSNICRCVCDTCQRITSEKNNS